MEDSWNAHIRNWNEKLNNLNKITMSKNDEKAETKEESKNLSKMKWEKEQVCVVIVE